MTGLAQPWLVRACQLVSGAVFVAAALPKIGDPAGFALTVHNFRVLPLSLEHLAAMTLPWIELVVGLVLILNVRGSVPRPFAWASGLTRAGAALAACLLVIFTLAVAQAVARDLDIACGCFGTADATRVGVRKLAENAGLVAMAAIGVLRPRG